MRNERGTYLVVMSLLLVVLIAFGALTLDLGRLFVLRSEMQNAADAAALAAAVELQNTPESRARAEAAARYLLQHEGKFSDVKELLGDNIKLEFYCAIGSEYDPDPVSDFCGTDYDADGRVIAAAGSNLEHYVRVTLEPDDENGPYSLQLFFLPVINFFLAEPGYVAGGGEAAPTRSYLRATAVAGRNFYFCRYPPVMICNPFEADGGNFNTEMVVGQQIRLKQQSGGAAWAPGNFAFLQPDEASGGGAVEVADYLADEGIMGCTRPIVTTATGGMTNKTAGALNTRMGVYGNPAPFNASNAPDRWPSAPNVIDYPRDQTWRASHPRFGQGDWDRNGYFTTYHDWMAPPPATDRPAGWETMTRWEVYNWEIAENKLPSKEPIIPGNADPAYDGIPDYPLNTGNYPPPLSIPERRVFHLAVINCEAHHLSGTKTFPIIHPEGFVKLFMTEQVQPPPNADIWVEYMGWSDESDEDYHLDIQLYE